jgi:hypothetical protein
VTHIYFVQRGDGPIKIGITKNLAGRLAALGTASHEPLHLLASVPGNSNAERHFHSTLAKYRIKGEWFRPCAEVLRLIEQVRNIGAAILRTGAHRWTRGKQRRRSVRLKSPWSAKNT